VTLTDHFDLHTDNLLKEVGFGDDPKPNLITEKIWLISYAATVRELSDGSVSFQPD
jgi:hypothetical protein